MSASFHGKRALVTGASRGIGRAISLALSKAGAQVYALSKTQEHLDQLIQEDSTMIPVRCNLSNHDEIKSVVGSIGPIDLLVNNAAESCTASFLDIKDDDMDRLLAANVKAVVHVSQIVCRDIISRGGTGAVVNISTFTKPVIGACLSQSCKAAVDQITKAMALELGPHKIRTNSLGPGAVSGTDIIEHYKRNFPAEVEKMEDKTPIGKISTTEDCAAAVLFLLSDRAAMFNGAHLVMDGGFSLA